jgi:hypothetical protein
MALLDRLDRDACDQAAQRVITSPGWCAQFYRNAIARALARPSYGWQQAGHRHHWSHRHHRHHWR